MHLTQGFRSNGLVAHAQRQIRRRSEDRHFVVMETVQEKGPIGELKHCLYGWHLHRWAGPLDGVLSIGHRTTSWLEAVAPRSLAIHPFAYFLPEAQHSARLLESSPRFRFLFVGQLIPRKRVEALLSALVVLDKFDFELDLIGEGPEGERLRVLAEGLLPGRIRFLGTLPMSEVPAQMSKADCLVLPSMHDGWGAVVSEAMLVGTPVVCSTACGAAGVVDASGCGGTFDFDNPDAFQSALKSQLSRGKVTPAVRVGLANWARCLGAEAGAAYVERILEARIFGGARPTTPWERDSEFARLTADGFEETL